MVNLSLITGREKEKISSAMPDQRPEGGLPCFTRCRKMRSISEKHGKTHHPRNMAGLDYGPPPLKPKKTVLFGIITLEKPDLFL